VLGDTRPLSLRVFRGHVELSMASVSALRNITDALRDPSYGAYAIGNVLSLIGTWMQRVGIGWLTWEMTGSGAWLGVIAFADLFPVVIVAPLAGALCDRWDSFKVIKLGQWLSIGQTAVLYALFATDQLTIELLVVLTALMGIFSALHQPARLAIVPFLVEKKHLQAAIAIGSISFNTAQFVGPALAGIAIATSGVGATIWLNGLSFALFLVTLLWVRPRSERVTNPKGGILTQLAAGIRYSVAHPGIGRGLVLITAIALLGRPFMDLFPGFADRIFNAGPTGLAMLTSSVGGGAILGGLWLAQRPAARGLTRIILLSLFWTAIMLFIFTATDLLAVAVAASFIAGVCLTSVGIGTQMLFQVAVSPDMRGRVMSLYVVLFRAVPAIGALIMGLASEVFGLRWPIVGGAVLLLAVFFWTWSARKRTADALEPIDPVPGSA